MDDKARERRPDEMGRPRPDEPHAEVMGRPESGTAEVMGGPEPAEEETDVMGGPGRSTDVMRDRGRADR